MGFYLVVFAWNWPASEREFTRDIELDPNSAEAHFRYAQLYLGPVGRYQEAVKEYERSLELEPLNINAGNNFAAVYTSESSRDCDASMSRR